MSDHKVRVIVLSTENLEEDNGGGIVKGPYDDAHERRAVARDDKGNGFAFYKPLPR